MCGIKFNQVHSSLLEATIFLNRVAALVGRESAAASLSPPLLSSNEAERPALPSLLRPLLDELGLMGMQL